MIADPKAYSDRELLATLTSIQRYSRKLFGTTIFLICQRHRAMVVSWSTAYIFLMFAILNGINAGYVDEHNWNILCASSDEQLHRYISCYLSRIPSQLKNAYAELESCTGMTVGDITRNHCKNRAFIITGKERTIGSCLAAAGDTFRRKAEDEKETNEMLKCIDHIVSSQHVKD